VLTDKQLQRELGVNDHPESKTVHKPSEPEGRTGHFDLLQG